MIENDAFKLLLINLFHLNPDDIANILCTTFNKMMVLVVTLTDKHSALTTQKCIIKLQGKTLQMLMLWKDLL